MIIDLILDRKDGYDYNKKDAINYIQEEEEIFNFNYGIADALKNNDEEATKKALCDYITENNYNPKICDYINSVNWTDQNYSTTYLMRKNEKEFSDYSIMKLTIEYKLILKTIDILGCLIQVEGSTEAINNFSKRFNLKKVDFDYYKNNFYR